MKDFCRKYVTDKSLGWFLLCLFFASFNGTIYAGLESGESPVQIAYEILANLQSEWLQLFCQVVAPVYLIYRGSPVSRDGQDRMEALIQQIHAQQQIIHGLLQTIVGMVEKQYAAVGTRRKNPGVIGEEPAPGA